MNAAAVSASPSTSAAPAFGRELAVLSLGLAAVVSAQAMLNVGLPDLARDIGATQTQALWVVNAYSLVFAALLLPAAAIGELVGRRRAFLTGLGIFAGAGIAGALVRDPTLLIVLRGLAGVGGALVMPISLTIITATFPAEQRGKAVGIWAGVSGAAGTLGLVIAGVLLDPFGWTSIFWLSAGLAVLALAATVMVVPESRDEQAAPLDVPGTALAVAALGGIVYGVIEQPQRGWSDAGVLIGLIGGTVALIVFVLVELRRERPMLDPRLFGNRAFGTGNLSVALQYATAFGLFVIIFQYLQYALGYSTLESGLAIVPQGAAIVLSAGLADGVGRRLGLGLTGAIGLGLIAGGFALLAVLVDVDSSYWDLLPGLMIAGAGIGLSGAAATASALSGAPAHARGSASGINNASKEVGGAIGIAAMGALLNSGYSSNVDVHGLNPAQAGVARDSIAGALSIVDSLGARGASLASSAQEAVVSGLQSALWVGTGVLALAAVVLLVLGPRAGEVRLDVPEPDPDPDADPDPDPGPGPGPQVSSVPDPVAAG
ncbi:MAG TPA: MFS transporter [Solirubrobacteraceae bacterium]|nr:MFS transporter [Solirubrobacteraceae bacterium]